MSILTAGMKAVQDTFMRAPAKVLSQKDKDARARFQNTMRRIESGEYQKELRAFEAEREKIAAKVHAGELTTQALARHGERMRPLVLEREQYNCGGQQFLLDTCTDTALLAEGVALRHSKQQILKRLQSAKIAFDTAEESVYLNKREYDKHVTTNAERRRTWIAVDEQGEATLKARLLSSEAYRDEAKADLAELNAELAEIEKLIADNKTAQMLS